MNLRESNEQTPPMLAIVFIVLSATEEWNSLLCIRRIKGGGGEEVKEEHGMKEKWAGKRMTGLIQGSVSYWWCGIK